MKSAVIFLASSRSEGETAQVVNLLKSISEYRIIDLKKLDISHFDYEHLNHEDDFIPLIKDCITNYDTFIFATPVYWYSMSGIMKVFLDRFSDLLTIKKPLGRKLRGKNFAVLSVCIDRPAPNGFYKPFELSANYLGMIYLGHAHIQSVHNTTKIEKFYNKIQ